MNISSYIIYRTRTYVHLEVIEMKKRYILKSKMHFCLFITSMILISMILFYSINTYGYKEKEYDTLIVIPGDTLWGIAEKNNKDGDIRKYIYEIKK